MLASGEAADGVARSLRLYGADIEVLAGPAGLAATRKLLRSVFYKGMAASIVEPLEAARAAGLEDWLTGHIAEDLASQDAATLARIVTGTRQHAVRRGHEMAAAAEMLTDLGVSRSWPPPASTCTSAWPPNSPDNSNKRPAPRAPRPARREAAETPVSAELPRPCAPEVSVSRPSAG